MRLRDHDADELSFILKGTTISNTYSIWLGELWGIKPYSYDLGRHQGNQQDLTYFDDQKNEKYLPYVIEPSLGADRVVLPSIAKHMMKKISEQKA